MQAAQRPAPDVERYAPLRIAGAKAAFLERVAAEDAGKKTSFICQLFQLDQPNSGDCKGAELHGKAADGAFLAEIRSKYQICGNFPSEVILPGQGRKLIGRAKRGLEQDWTERDKVSLLVNLFRLRVPARNTCLCRRNRGAAASEVTAKKAVDFVTGSPRRVCGGVRPRVATPSSSVRMV